MLKINRKIRWTSKEIKILKEGYKKGTSVKLICKKLRRSYYSVTTKSKRLKLKHPYLTPTFKPILTPEFAYVLGAWLGDRTSPKKLGICVKDYNFIISFANSLRKVLGKSIRLKIHKYGQKYFIQRIDRNFVTWIKQNNLKNIIKFIYIGDEAPISNFLRGFFDAEGTVIEKEKYTQVTQKNNEILKECKFLLKKLKIDSSLWKGKNKKSSYYVLRIFNLKSLLRFYNIIGFNIKRKNETLKNIINRKISSKNFYPVKDYFKFSKMIKNGMSCYKIAEYLSVSTATVYNWANGIKPKIIKTGLTEEDLLKFNNNILE